MAFMSLIDLVRGCVYLADTIRDLAQNTSFLRDQCDQLSDLVSNLVHPLEELKGKHNYPQTSQDRRYLQNLSDTLEECEELLEKCCCMGIFKSLRKKASYAEKFTQLEKKLRNMELPASLITMVRT